MAKQSRMQALQLMGVEDEAGRRDRHFAFLILVASSSMYTHVPFLQPAKPRKSCEHATQPPGAQQVKGRGTGSSLEQPGALTWNSVVLCEGQQDQYL